MHSALTIENVSPERLGQSVPAAKRSQADLSKEILQYLPIQTKLSIGAVDDPLEEEADQMADKVMRMPEQSFIQRKCAHCEEEERAQRKPLTSFIQKKQSPINTTVASDTVSSRIGSTRGSGHAMPEGTKSFMESRFSADFSNINIHTGGYASQLSNDLNAQAFTVGNDIYFNEGKYAPESDTGKHLLAHELTHTIQQGSTPLLQRQSNETRSERYEADTRPNAASRLPPVPRMDTDQVGNAGPPSIGQCAWPGIGTLRWWLVPREGLVHARIEFIPVPNLVPAGHTITFIQTVEERTFANIRLFSPNHDYGSPRQVDALSSYTDPFYGASWNSTTNQWGDEPNSVQSRPGDRTGNFVPREGSRPYNASSPSAVINDSPMLDFPEGYRGMEKDFETVAVCTDTGQVFASLSWNIQRWATGLFSNRSTSTIVRRAICSANASADFRPVVNAFYQNGIVTINGFASNSDVLPANHGALLAPVVSRLSGNTRRVLLGGSASANETNPEALSRRRAEAVKQYLVGHGIDQARVVVEAYGSHWARTLSSQTTATADNQRVQIRQL